MPPIMSPPREERSDAPVLTSSTTVTSPAPPANPPESTTSSSSLRKPAETVEGAVGSSAEVAAPPASSIPRPLPTSHAPRSVGLINEGCTCYLNSLLQLLFHINYFRTAVYRIPPELQGAQKSLCTALQELFFEMQERTTPARTRALTTAFGWGEEELMVQHDIQEMATLLRHALEEKMKGTEAEGTIHQLFEGRGEQVVETLDHSYTSRRRDSFYDIHLPLANHRTLMDSLMSLTAKDQLVGDNKYRVEEEGKPAVYKDAEKDFRFCRFAPVTWFHLKRFDMDLTSPTLEMKKVNTALGFPLVLDLQDLEQNEECATPKAEGARSPASPLQQASPAIYDLHGVIVHRGTVNSGHYYCYIRAWDPQKQAFAEWVEYDDENVRTVTEELAVAGNFGGPPAPGRQRYGDLRGNSASAYVLSYVRRAAAPALLAPCPTDVITQNVKDALRKNMEAEERRVRRAEEARQRLTVYVLTEASLGACTLDLLTSLLPSDMSKLRRYAEATLELKKHDPLQLAYEQLDELLLAPCGFPIEQCRFWRISGGPPTAPSQPGAGGLAYTIPTSSSNTSSATANTQGTPAGTATSGGSLSSGVGTVNSHNTGHGGAAAGMMAGERSSLNTRELHVGRALPTWQECVQHHARHGEEPLRLIDLLTPTEKQKANIIGLFLQGPVLPIFSPLAPGLGMPRSNVASPTTTNAPTKATNAADTTSNAAGVLCVGPSPVVKSCTVSPANMVVEMVLASPIPLLGLTVTLAQTSAILRSCTLTVQLYSSELASPVRFQETLVVNAEDMRVTWRQPKVGTAATEGSTPAVDGSTPKLRSNTGHTPAPTTATAPFTGRVSSVKFQLTNAQSGKPLLIVDAHVHVAPDRLRLSNSVREMVLAEPGYDRVLLFFKLFNHTLCAVRYLGEGIIDRALTPRHCEEWLLHLSGAERALRDEASLAHTVRPPRLRFFEETHAGIARELRPDVDWMDNRIHSGSTIVVQRSVVAPLYRHVHIETFYRTQKLKELVRVVEIVSVLVDAESEYRERLAHFAEVRRTLPSRSQALSAAVDAFNEYRQKEREKKMLETARAAAGRAASSSSTLPAATTTPAGTTKTTAAAGGSSGGEPTAVSNSVSSSTRSLQGVPRVAVDVELNPFSSTLPVLEQEVLTVTGQAMCTMHLTWCYDSVCDAIAEHFMVTPGSIRLYRSRDAEGTGPQRAPASTTVVLEDLLRLDAYTTTNVIFFERLTLPRVTADQFAVFNVTLRDAEGHALHSERYSLNRAESTRQGVVRAVRQSIRDWERAADPWGTLEATLNATHYTLLVVSEETHVISVIKEVRLSARDGTPYVPENALDADWQGLHLVLIPLGVLPRGEERIACCHGEYRNGEVHTFGHPFVITVHETTTVAQAMGMMLACTHVPAEVLHRENRYAAMMLTERACYFSDWEETIVMYWRCTQNTSDHVPQLVLNYSNPLDKPGSRYVAHHDHQLKITQ